MTNPNLLPMVEQRFDPALDQEPAIKRLVETASEYLQEETQETAHPAIAEWTLISDEVPERVSLFIRDTNLPDVWAGRSFSIPELQDFDELEKKIIRLWGKVLEHRSKARPEKAHGRPTK